MEFFFKKLSEISATVILLILVSIFVVLFIQAKPAIKEHGFHFLMEKRWGVTVKLNNTTNIDKQQAISQNAIDD